MRQKIETWRISSRSIAARSASARGVVEGVEVVGDGAHAVEHALAAHLAGVGGDHRRDQGVAQQLDHRLAVRRPRPSGCAARRPGCRAALSPPRPRRRWIWSSAMLVICRKQANEWANRTVSGRLRPSSRSAISLGGLRRALAVEGDGGLADLLDLVEHRLAVLGADHVAQHPAQEPDGGAELVGQRAGSCACKEKPQRRARVIWFPAPDRR